MGYYLVESKDDDYGNKKFEFVKTTAKHADEYYGFTKVADEDAPILEKYMGLVDEKEEAKRTAEERFYGN